MTEAPDLRDREPEPLVVPLSLDGSEALTFDVGLPPEAPPGGWAALHSPQMTAAKLSLWMRFGSESPRPGVAVADQPIVLRELMVSSFSGEIALGSALWRTIPLRRITAAVNRVGTRARILPLLPPANLITRERPGSGMDAWTLPPREAVALPVPDLRIQDPGERRKPDSFYKQVADAYLAQATLSNSPAQDLSAANSVPVTTVHRWLKEARGRGLLRLPDAQG